MFMIDLHTKFDIPIYKWLSGTATRLEGLRNFSHDCHVFYKTTTNGKILLTELSQNSVAVHNFRA